VRERDRVWQAVAAQGLVGREARVGVVRSRTWRCRAQWRRRRNRGPVRAADRVRTAPL